MVTLQDIDVSLERAQQLMRFGLTPDGHAEVETCLGNARQMLIELGRDSTAALERITDTLEALSDITQG